MAIGGERILRSRMRRACWYRRLVDSSSIMNWSRSWRYALSETRASKRSVVRRSIDGLNEFTGAVAYVGRVRSLRTRRALLGWSLCLLVPLLGSGLESCRTATDISIASQPVPAGTFAHFSTYRWRSPEAPVPQAGASGATLDREIRKATEGALAEKGYVMVGSGPADLLVDYQVTILDKQTNSFREFADCTQRGGEGMLAESYAAGYQEGTLVLELYASSSDHRVCSPSP